MGIAAVVAAVAAASIRNHDIPDKVEFDRSGNDGKKCKCGHSLKAHGEKCVMLGCRCRKFEVVLSQK